jgi:hypothetical protein
MNVAAHAMRDVAADPATVFALANSAEDAPRLFTGWGPFPATDRVEVIGGAPLEVGARRRVYFSDGSQILEEILAYDPGSAWSYSLVDIGRPFALLVREGRADWRLEKHDEGVRVRWTCTFELQSALLWPVASVPMLLFGRMMHRTLANIAHACEPPRG